MCGEKGDDSVLKMDDLYTNKMEAPSFVCIMGEIQMENKCAGGNVWLCVCSFYSIAVQMSGFVCVLFNTNYYNIYIYI